MDNIINKIKKLLALSKSPNEHEAAIALEKAHALLKQYNLQKQQIEEAELEEQTVKQHCRNSQWKGILFRATAKLNYCVGYWQPYTDGYWSMKLTGRDSNVITARLMYDYLEKTIERICRKECPKQAKKKYRDAFKTGIAVRISMRVDEMVGADTDREKQLARISELKGLANRKDKFPKAKSNALANGFLRGKSIGLNRQVNSSENRVFEIGA